MRDDDASPSRRQFIAQVAGGASALAAASLVAGDLLAQGGGNPPPPQGGWDMSWVDKVQRAKHRVVFDAPGIAEGTALNNVGVWLSGYSEVYKTADADMAAVLVFRHKGLPVVLNDDMWKRLKLGDDDKLLDPATGDPTQRNPFLNAKQGDRHATIRPDGGLDAMIARGAIVLCCNLALMRHAGALAKAENMPIDQARQALIDALVPGVIRMPNGVFATTRAEEAGCLFLRAT